MYLVASVSLYAHLSVRCPSRSKVEVRVKVKGQDEFSGGQRQRLMLGARLCRVQQS